MFAQPVIGLVHHAGRGRAAILRIHGREQNALAASGHQFVQLAGHGGIAIAHRPFDLHALAQPLGQLFRLLRRDGSERRASFGPHFGIGGGAFARADIEDDAAQDHLPDDLRDLDYESTFDAVVFWGASFGYFEDEKNAEVLRLIFRALKPGGKLILDVPNRDFTIQTEPNQSWFQMDGCLCMDDMNLDYISSRVRVKRTMMLDDGRNLEATYSMRVYSLHELGRIMHEAGYRVSQVTGHPVTPGVFIGNCSHRIIMLAHKPEA